MDYEMRTVDQILADLQQDEKAILLSRQRFDAQMRKTTNLYYASVFLAGILTGIWGLLAYEWFIHN